MNFEFSSIEFAHIGKTTGSKDMMWSQLEIRLLDTEGRRFSRAKLTLPVPRRPDVTYSELQNVARDHAIEFLRETLRCLEEHDVTTLERLTEEREGRYFELEKSAES